MIYVNLFLKNFYVVILILFMKIITMIIHPNLLRSLSEYHDKTRLLTLFDWIVFNLNSTNRCKLNKKTRQMKIYNIVSISIK